MSAFVRISYAHGEIAFEDCSQKTIWQNEYSI